MVIIDFAEHWLQWAEHVHRFATSRLARQPQDVGSLQQDWALEFLYRVKDQASAEHPLAQWTRIICANPDDSFVPTAAGALTRYLGLSMHWWRLADFWEQGKRCWERIKHLRLTSAKEREAAKVLVVQFLRRSDVDLPSCSFPYQQAGILRMDGACPEGSQPLRGLPDMWTWSAVSYKCHHVYVLPGMPDLSRVNMEVPGRLILLDGSSLSIGHVEADQLELFPGACLNLNGRSTFTLIETCQSLAGWRSEQSEARIEGLASSVRLEVTRRIQAGSDVPLDINVHSVGATSAYIDLGGDSQLITSAGSSLFEVLRCRRLHCGGLLTVTGWLKAGEVRANKIRVGGGIRVGSIASFSTIAAGLAHVGEKNLQARALSIKGRILKGRVIAGQVELEQYQHPPRTRKPKDAPRRIVRRLALRKPAETSLSAVDGQRAENQ